jgi:hypothetical protein
MLHHVFSINHSPGAPECHCTLWLQHGLVERSQNVESLCGYAFWLESGETADAIRDVVKRPTQTACVGT